MSFVLNEVRRGFYLDSVALMRLARAAQGHAGVEDAGLMIGTPANKDILRDAGLLVGEGEAAGPGDLVIAVRGIDFNAAEASIAAIKADLDRPRVAQGPAAGWRPQTLRAAVEADPVANFALISVPGAFAAAEARKALRHGLNVMIFSDNVAIEDEVALKQEGRALGLMVMGPDCGTAVIGGVPLAFANAVPRGSIGLIGASGTGLQEVSCLIAAAGKGISHAIGTGGRDLGKVVGGITTMMAIDALEADPETTSIVLVSKPPEPAIARLVLDRLARAAKPSVVCFIGGAGLEAPPGPRMATTLHEAAELAAGPIPKLARRDRLAAPPGRPFVRGLFAGGTLCSEAQVIFREAQVAASSNVPIPGLPLLTATVGGHQLVDLGDDLYTRGRPHPMIEPSSRDAALTQALSDPEVAVILLDVVLGYGGHGDPAGHLATMLTDRPGRGPVIVASVTGTEADPQVRSHQVAKLEACGVVVAASNADAARLAISLIGPAAE